MTYLVSTGSSRQTRLWLPEPWLYAEPGFSTSALDESVGGLAALTVSPEPAVTVVDATPSSGLSTLTMDVTFTALDDSVSTAPVVIGAVASQAPWEAIDPSRMRLSTNAAALDPFIEITIPLVLQTPPGLFTSALDEAVTATEFTGYTMDVTQSTVDDSVTRPEINALKEMTMAHVGMDVSDALPSLVAEFTYTAVDDSVSSSQGFSSESNVLLDYSVSTEMNAVIVDIPPPPTTTVVQAGFVGQATVTSRTHYYRATMTDVAAFQTDFNLAPDDSGEFGGGQF